jgi:hypothetical protein
MGALESKRWIRVAVFGILYGVIGYGSTFLIYPSVRFWRLAAWVGSAVVFAIQLAFEHFRLENTPARTALNTASAVALGGLLLAVAATTHALSVNEHAPYVRFAIALVAWPLITGVPAFLAAIVIAATLRWLKIPRRATT